MKRVLIVTLFASLVASVALAQRIEKLPAFSGVAPEAVKAALETTGYRVFLPNTLAACDVWFANNISTAKRADAKDAVYQELSNSEFLGVITFPRGGAQDFRGQKVRLGTYTMRYQMLPSDGNHLGVAPNPDFVLLIPVQEDADPAARYEFGKLVELSANAAHSHHPASFEMMPAEAGEAHATQTDDGWIVLHAPLTTKDGNKVQVAIVVKGSAAQ